MDLVGLKDTLISFVQPLDSLLVSGPVELGAELGYDFEPVADSLGNLTDTLSNCSETTAALADAVATLATADNVTPTMIADAATSTIDWLNAFRRLRASFQDLPSGVRTHLEVMMGGDDIEAFAQEFSKRVMGYLASAYMRKTSPGVHTAFNLLGILGERRLAADPTRFRLACTQYDFRLEALPELLSNPKAWLAQLYAVNGVAGLELLVSYLETFLLTQMAPVSRIELPQVSLEAVGRLVPSAQLATVQSQGLSADLFNTLDPQISISARLLPLLGSSPPEAGFVAEVTAQGSTGDYSWAPGTGAAITLSTSTEVETVARAAFFSGEKPGFELTSSASVGPIRGVISYESPADLLDLTIKGVGGFRIDRIGVALGMQYDATPRYDLFGEVHLMGAELQIGGSSADGFLKKIFPGEGLHGTFELTVGVSSERGLYASGSGGLELTLPVHQDIGPVRLESIYVGTFATPPDLELRAGISLAVKLGPVAASVERVGARILLPIGGGDPAVRFLPPLGAGLAIDADGISGGGYIDHDEALGRYSGILDLNFGDIALVAVAIITTKRPGGKKGYALFVNIGVTFSPPITLPYNFNLQGCGGLLALNRTISVDRLRSGLKAKTLDSILFPEDPILNAAKIISDSEAVFPIEEGRFVVGPMVKLGWGPAGLITADIAIIIELPSPVTIVLLGQVKARLPKGDEAKIKINIDVLGVLSFSKKELSIDAEIYDSSIVVYKLSGGSALRLRWGSTPVFAMSLGGFHPKFDPPPKFPSLKRLTLELSSGSNLSLSCTVYNALTSNSIQFGARLHLHAEACGAELDGRLSFDTLIIFSPFEFEIDMSGSISASYHGHDVASIHLSLDLSGPNPWHAKGKAKISVACFDCTAKFNKSWGKDEKARLPKIDPLQPFLDELDVVANWGSGMLPRRSAVESLKGLEPGPTTPQPFILAHPAGALEVRQRLLPLDLELEKFANAEVKNHFKFDIRLALGPEASPTPEEPLTNSPDLGLEEERIEEKFAVGQFRDWSKSTRLSHPSYEPKKAGVRTGPQKARLDGMPVPCDLEYESTVIKKDGVKSREVRLPSWLTLRRTLGFRGLQLAGVQHQGMGKFKIGGPPRITVRDEGYSVVDSATLAPIDGIKPASGRPLGMTDAEDLARTSSGSVLVVPEYEEEPV